MWRQIKIFLRHTYITNAVFQNKIKFLQFNSFNEYSGIGTRLFEIFRILFCPPICIPPCDYLSPPGSK